MRFAKLQAILRTAVRIKQVDRKVIIVASGFAALAIFLTTLQLHVNGSNHPYATDVGEIQNALPRWGTLHFTGYPQYSVLGSLFVTLLRPILSPAISTSLFSAVWGAISVGLLVWLMIALNIPTWAAAGASLMFAFATSFWVDASIAEIHTMTMALTFGTMLAAYRFGKSGSKSDLYWFSFLAGQGLAHQRAFAFLGLGLLIFILPKWRVLMRSLPVSILLGLLGPLTYLYLPLRAWMGADWTFSSPGTWEGFRAIVLDTKAERIIEIPTTLAEWQQRFRDIIMLLNADWPWPLWLGGLSGLLLPGCSRLVRLALMLSWIPFFAVGLIIWEGYVSDALLAVKLPVIALAAIGWGCWAHFGQQRHSLALPGFLLFSMLINGWLIVKNSPQVLTVTRDTSAFTTIAQVERIPESGNHGQTLMALWGHDYWALTYAQEYEGAFPYLDLVDHDTNFSRVIAEGDALMTLSKTFYQRPLSWWQDMLDSALFLTVVAPGIVQIQTTPNVTAVSPTSFDLGNDTFIQSTQLTWQTETELQVMATWQAEKNNLPDYSVAIHLVTQNPPTGPQDILAQADEIHPVDGWYPTSRWQVGELVTDYYLLDVPVHVNPAAVRIAMYRQIDGVFQNSNWLSLPVPQRPFPSPQ